MNRTALNPDEPHPAAPFALDWLCFSFLKDADKVSSYEQGFATCAIEGNRLGEICGETLRRLLAREHVSDRYLLGLAWAIRSMEADDRVAPLPKPDNTAPSEPQNRPL